MSDGSEPREPRELSAGAADLEAQIKGTLNGLVGDDTPPEPADTRPPATGKTDDLSIEARPPDPGGEPISRETAGAVLGMLHAQVEADDPGSSDGLGRGRRPRRRVTAVQVLISAVLALLGFTALVAAWRWMDWSDDTVADQSQEAGQVTGDAAPGSVAPADAARCVVPADQIVVVNKVTADLEGKRDTDLFAIAWDTTVTNNSPTRVLMTSRLASSNDGEAGWTFGVTPIESGGNLELPGNYLDNNTGGAAGGLNWRLVGQVAAVVDTPECSALLAKPEALPPEAIVAVPIPDHPAGVEVPVG